MTGPYSNSLSVTATVSNNKYSRRGDFRDITGYRSFYLGFVKNFFAFQILTMMSKVTILLTEPGFLFVSLKSRGGGGGGGVEIILVPECFGNCDKHLD